MEIVSAPKVSFSPAELTNLLQSEGLPQALRQTITPRGISLEGADPRLLESALLLGTLMASNSRQLLLEAAAAGNADARRIVRAYCGFSAVYPGSFDPFTRGHRDLVERALKVFDNLVVAVGVNNEKNPLFTREERIDLIREDLKEFGGRVQVTAYNDLLVKFCERNNISLVVRGVRTLTDWDAELKLARFNFDHSAERVETLMMPAREGGSYVSSSSVKELAKLGWSVSTFLSPHIESALKNRLGLPDLPGEEAMSSELKALIPLLERKWCEVTRAASAADEEKDAVFAEVLNAWCSAKRSHHSIRHLAELIQWIEAHCPAELKNTLVLAAFGHDAILDPRRRDNEERSARWFDARLSRIALGEAVRADVSRIIVATNGHFAASDPLVDWFLTADLSILATPRDRYMQYAGEVAEEYLKAVTPQGYISGRQAFLSNMLKRESIFPRLPLAAELDKAARENMEFELKVLSECPNLILKN